jgi:hypothetical protein
MYRFTVDLKTMEIKTMEKMRILVACEESQAVTKELRKLGHDDFSCDIVDCTGGQPDWHIKGDAVKVAYEQKWDMMIAHPPCTRLTNAGVRWLKVPPNNKSLVDIWRELFEGAALYKALRDAPIPKKCLENPIMHKYAKELISIDRRQVVQPWWFGEEMFKATGFELIGLPDLIPTKKLEPPKTGTEEHKAWSWVHRMPPGPNRASLRSKTPHGIARAMAEQWAGKVN